MGQDEDRLVERRVVALAERVLLALMPPRDVAVERGADVNPQTAHIR
jgi:hypothetical protein